MRRAVVALALVVLTAGCTDGRAAAPTSGTTAPLTTAATVAAGSTTTAPAAPSSTAGTAPGPAPAPGDPSAPPVADAGACGVPGDYPGPWPDAGACGVPGDYPGPWPDRPRYTVHLAVDPAARVVTGDVTVRFVPDADTDRLVFRLWPSGPRIAGGGGRLDVTATELAGQPAAGRYEAGGAPAGRGARLRTAPLRPRPGLHDLPPARPRGRAQRSVGSRSRPDSGAVRGSLNRPENA